MTTIATKRLPASWLILAALLLFSLGMMGGFLREADLVARDFAYSGIVHTPGRVAGATTDMESGAVTMRIRTDQSSVTYSIETKEPLSPYNLLRIAETRSRLAYAGTQRTDGSFVLTELNGSTATGGAQWIILLNGRVITDFNESTIIPGDTVEFSLSQ